MPDYHLGDILIVALSFGLLFCGMIGLAWFLGRLMSRDGNEDGG